MINKPVSADDLILQLVHEGSFIPRGKTINAGMFPEAKRQLAEAIEWIIGEDLSLIEYRPGFIAKPDTETAIQIEGKDRHNELLKEQRKRLAEWLGNA